MANVVCSKCGATAESKCPYCRTVFPDNQFEALLSWVLKWECKDDKIVVSYISHTADTVAEALEQAYSHLQQCKDRVGFVQYACEHTWVFAEGAHSDIDCGHK